MSLITPQLRHAAPIGPMQLPYSLPKEPISCSPASVAAANSFCAPAGGAPGDIRGLMFDIPLAWEPKHEVGRRRHSLELVML